MQEVFKRVDGKAAVAAQPSSEEERTKALQVCVRLSAPAIYIVAAVSVCTAAAGSNSECFPFVVVIKL
jgi:methylthioribose-1-phosphate isomerase